MNKKKVLITLSMLAIVTLFSIAIANEVKVNASYAGEITDSSDWEEEVFYPLADLFYNSSGALDPYSPMSESKGEFYTIHAVVGSKGVHLMEYFDKNGDQIHFASSKYSDEEPIDYTGWNSRDVDAQRKYTEYDLIKAGAEAFEYYNYSALDDTTLPTSSSDEYVRADDETEVTGVQYEAADGKTPIQIGEDVAAYDGYDFTELLNFTIVIFGFNDLDDLTNCMVYFDQRLDATPAASLNEYTVRRRAVQLFSRIQTGVRNKLTTVKDAFQRIGSNIISSLKELPAKATHILQKTVGSAFHNLKIGIKGFIGNIFKSIITFLTSTIGIAMTIGVIVLIVYKKKR